MLSTALLANIPKRKLRLAFAICRVTGKTPFEVAFAKTMAKLADKEWEATVRLHPMVQAQLRKARS